METFYIDRRLYVNVTGCGPLVGEFPTARSSRPHGGMYMLQRYQVVLWSSNLDMLDLHY